MPLVDITNPRVIIFLIESYEKETYQRVTWINKHRDKIGKAAVLKREPTNYYESDVIAHSMAEGMAAITRGHICAGHTRRKVISQDATFIPGVEHLRHGHSIVDVGLGDPKDDPRLARPDSDHTIDPIMRPVDPELTEVIYKPKPEFGKDKYLQKRNEIWPEKKYYFAECVNWDYGWRLKDSKMDQKPLHGRNCILTGTLHGRVGPQSDPPYYKTLDNPGPSKCTS